MAIKKLPSTGDRPHFSQTRTGLPAGITAGGKADSAGFPWEGRSFSHHDTAFAGDDGTAPPAYLAAVQQVRAAAAAYFKASAERDPAQISGSISALAGAQREALLALQEVRVLIPLLTVAGDIGVTPEGKTVEKTQELSIVTVAAPDGRKVMPVFSSTAAMQRWDPTARPIPVPLPQALLAAAEEQTELVIIDPGTTETEFGLRHNQFAVVAAAADFTPSWADPEIAALAAAELTADELVRLVALLPADPEMRLLTPETELVLGIVSGLPTAQMQAAANQAAQKWQNHPQLAASVDSLKLRVVAV